WSATSPRPLTCPSRRESNLLIEPSTTVNGLDAINTRLSVWARSPKSFTVAREPQSAQHSRSLRPRRRCLCRSLQLEITGHQVFHCLGGPAAHRQKAGVAIGARQPVLLEESVRSVELEARANDVLHQLRDLELDHANFLGLHHPVPIALADRVHE